MNIQHKLKFIYEGDLFDVFTHFVGILCSQIYIVMGTKLLNKKRNVIYTGCAREFKKKKKRSLDPIISLAFGYYTIRGTTKKTI